jgi:hypothetical protein
VAVDDSELVHRLTIVEFRLKELEKQLEDGVYVRRDVWEATVTPMAKAIADVAKDLDALDTAQKARTNAILLLVAGSLVSGIIAIAVSIVTRAT